MSRVRVCFLGTPDFAMTALKALLADEHFEVVGVVTQPDRPAGRKMQLTPSPVKLLALSHQLPFLTPENLKKEPQALEEIREWGAEIAIVVAYGQILNQDFLDSFKMGAVNIHGSLLPAWRGAAPIQRSLEAGDKITGVSLQKIVKRLDAGDVIAERRIEVPPEMDARELFDRLSQLGVELLTVDLMDYIRGNLAAKPQDESLVTHAQKIDKSEALVKWNLPAQVIHNKVRAFVLGPGTYIPFSGKKLKILKTRYLESEDDLKAGASELRPGQVVAVGDEGILVQCQSGQLLILEVQPESRGRMLCREFLKGHPIQVKDQL